MLRRWEPLEPLAYLNECRSSRHVFLGRVTADDSNINRLSRITVRQAGQILAARMAAMQETCRPGSKCTRDQTHAWPETTGTTAVHNQ